MNERRQAKRFEIPPWEAEQFEELQRRNEQEQAPPAGASSPETPEAAPVEAPGEAVAAAVLEHLKQEQQATGQPVPSPEAEDAAVQAMLAQLAEEEPRTDRQLRTAGRVAAWAIVAIGTVLVFWGAFAMAKTAGAGRFGLLSGGAIAALGALFVGAGIWVILTDLKKRRFV